VLEGVEHAGDRPAALSSRTRSAGRFDARTAITEHADHPVVRLVPMLRATARSGHCIMTG
jgi:hypothetical protein